MAGTHSHIHGGGTGGGGLREQVVFDTCGDDTFDPAAFPWLTRVEVEVVGGGGSGGGAEATDGGTTAEGGGGGGGGYTRGVIEAPALGGPVTVTVGCGAPAAGAGTPGNDGGTSSFGTLMTATGGEGGNAGPQSTGATTRAAGGRGGAGAGGDVNAEGGDGGTGLIVGTSVTKSGSGGGTVLGGMAVAFSLNAEGLGGKVYGGGSPGASNGFNQADRASSPGADGVVIVKLYE